MAQNIQGVPLKKKLTFLPQNNSTETLYILRAIYETGSTN